MFPSYAGPSGHAEELRGRLQCAADKRPDGVRPRDLSLWDRLNPDVLNLNGLPAGHGACLVRARLAGR